MSVKFNKVLFSIDKNYTVTNCNDSAKALFPEIKPGVPCYKAIRGYNAPCADCPIFNKNASCKLFYKCKDGKKDFFPVFSNTTLPDGSEGYTIIADTEDISCAAHDASLAFMKRKMDIYRQANYNCAYLYFEANLSRDMITTPLYEVVDYVEVEVDVTKRGLSLPMKYTDYHKWRLDGKVLSNRDEYRDLADCKKLIEKFNRGETTQELTFRARSTNGYMTWHNASLFMFKTEFSDDVYALYVVRDIDRKLNQEQAAKRNQEVMQILADEYSAVLYVEMETGIVSICSLPTRFLEKDIRDYITSHPFQDVWKYYVKKRVHNSDADHLLKLADMEYLKDLLSVKGSYAFIYRVGTEDFYTYSELKILKTSKDKLTSFVVGIADKNDAIREQQEQHKRLESALIMAQQDSLTGLRNRTAYDIAEKSLDLEVGKGSVREYAIAMFDINGLKYTNDFQGHDKGNLLLINSSNFICNIFNHSKVFRIGGDEFVAILVGSDYTNRDKLIRKFRAHILRNELKGEPIYENVSIASGIATYDPLKDKCVDDVFQRADKLMYENKAKIKARRIKNL